MTRRCVSLLLLVFVAVGAAWASGRASSDDRTQRQQQALARLGSDVEIELDQTGVPTQIRGLLSKRHLGDPIAAAERALEVNGAAFRRGPDDEFVYRVHEDDSLGQTHVRMEQMYRGIRVLGGELIVHMTRDAVIGINGHFVADIDIDTNTALSESEAIARAMHAVEADGGQVGQVVQVESPAIWAFSEDPALTIPILISYANGGEQHMDVFHVDAHTGDIAGIEPRLYSAKNRKIYNLNQTCVSTGSELPGTLMFTEGGSSSDTAAMGAYNGTGTTYDYYKATFNRDSYDNAGGNLVSSVHGQFSTGFSCTKNNAAWLDDPYNQMAYGDGDGSTFSNLANGLDVTGHELTHGVTSRTAKLAYQKESGALNEAASDILGRSAAFWAGDGNSGTKTDWVIGKDVYTPGTSGDALRYMYDPKKDGQSADYYPTRNYSGSCTPSSSNDYCGVHTNSGIANLEYFLLAFGGTHPRGSTTVNVPGIGLSKAQQIWYRALTVYMTSSTTFQGARTATASAAADLYGGSCSVEWQSVQKSWDAVGVSGTWSCGTTYSISGSVGTGSATVTAGSASTTADASGTYTISGLAAGTYTVTPSKTGCTFTPASQSVTVGPSATGVNFSASCGGGGSQQLLANSGFESGAVSWTTTSGVIDNSTTYPARTGSWKAWMNGYGFYSTDTMAQTVTIPASATKATLSFYLRISTAETTSTYAYDKLKVQLRTTGGSLLKTLYTYSNLNKSSSYILRSFDITAYKGQTLQVYFYGTEDYAKATSFLIDDTALNVQ